jgi:hypothetical protein
MHFTPYLQDGVPVQVVSRASLHFAAVRPASVEMFESARTYFERGRHVGFPAAANGAAYVLTAEIHARGSDGSALVGQYVDTWISDSDWRREASIGKSRYVRSRHGEQRYELAEGPDIRLLKFVLKAMEPIPALDTFVESDWKIKRAAVEGVQTIRVLTGYESPEGVLDPAHVRAYWFDETGRLVKTFFTGLESVRSEIEDFGGVAIARQIKVSNSAGVGLFIRVTEVSPAVNVSADEFVLKGHEWTRAFTTTPEPALDTNPPLCNHTFPLLQPPCRNG